MWCRNIQQCFNWEWGISRIVEFEFVCQFWIGNVFIKFVVIFWSDFILISHPNGRDNILSLTINNDWIIDEVGVTCNCFEDFSLLTEFSLFWFQVDCNFSSSTLEIVFCFRNLKSSSAIRNPNICFIRSITLADHFNCITNNEWWIKTNTKLTNDFIIHLWAHLLQKLFWTTSCDCTEIVDHFLFCHTNTRVLYYKMLTILQC